MADVRVRYTGKLPIIVNGATWFQDEIHQVHEKTAQALMAMRAAQGDVFVLPLPGMVWRSEEGTSEDVGPTADGTDGTDGTDDVPGEVVVAEKPAKRRRK